MGALRELPIAAPPGVVKTDSKLSIQGRFSDTINMRFVKGRPQKVGGNVLYAPTPTDGVPRSMHAWRDNSFNQNIAVGTYKKLYIYDQSLVQYDVTPYRSQGSLGSNPFSTQAGSAVVTVTHTAHGVSPGDQIYYAGAVTFNSIPFINTTANTPWTVATVVDANTYTFVATGAASSTGSGGGASVTYKYEIPVGTELGSYGLGWGVGQWGIGTWGDPHPSSTIAIEPRIWSLDHFGQLLIAAYNGGGIYQFDPTQLQPWPRATVLDASAPTNCRAMFVTPERFIMALLDNMQVAWPSQGSLTDWTPSTTNTANVRTVTEGTKLVTGRVLSDFVSLVWTDAALYRFQYTGSTFVYASSMIAKDCGAISPNGCVTVGGVAYWMGQDSFWTYNGTVSTMPNVNDIRKYVFDAVRVDYSYQCWALYSPQFNEVWFFYTVEGATNPTLGVIYSIDEQCWAPLYFGRCGGTHFTQGDTRPLMGKAEDFKIYQQESGNDDNGAILPWSMTISPYSMTPGGQQSMLLEYIAPDFFEQVGSVTMTVTTWDRLNDSVPLETATGIATAVDSGIVDYRISGRYVGWTASGSELGSYVRLGLPVAFIRPMGNRK